MSPEEDILEGFIRQACEEMTRPLSEDGKIFSTSPSYPGTTINTKDIRILVYCGAFNPPHQGHLRLLAAALSFGYNIYNAAIILPYEDTHPASKPGPGEIALTIDERARLCRAGLPPELSAKTWPCTLGFRGFCKFWPRLRKIAEINGYTIDLDELAGLMVLPMSKTN